MSKYDRAFAYAPTADINTIIARGETILWSGKPKKSAFIINQCLTLLPFAVLWLAFYSGLISQIFFEQSFFNTGSPFFLFSVAIFALQLMPVWLWLRNVLTANRQWKNTAYAATDRRLIIQSGVIGMEYKTIYYKDIQHVSLRVGAIDKLLRVGDIYFIRPDAAASRKSRSDLPLAFFDIEDAHTVYPLLQKIVMDIQTDIAYPNELRPKTNPGYQTAYKPR